MTAAVVLAAGLGRRLAQATALPKWLAPVNASCPAEVQLTAFERGGIDRTLVVVGPGAEAVERLVSRWRNRLHIEIVRNDHATDRNNWFSLLLGLEAWRAGEGDREGDVVVVNSDLFAAPEWFESLLAATTGLGAEAALAVDPARGRTEEAMKVAVDVHGIVRGIGKVGIPDPDGEYVGLAWFRRAAADGLLAELHAFVGVPERSDHWYEHAIQEHLLAGAAYRSLAVPTSEWVEIDDENDLIEAKALGV